MSSRQKTETKKTIPLIRCKSCAEDQVFCISFVCGTKERLANATSRLCSKDKKENTKGAIIAHFLKMQIPDFPVPECKLYADDENQL